MRLLHEAAEAYPGLTYAGLTPERLVRITAERGVDVATAVLYDRLRRSPEHGPFIARVEALSPQPRALPRLRGSVLVAPAAFFQEFPGSGGDGLLVRDVAGAFGLRTDVLPVSSTGTVTQNAALIREALAAEPDGSVLLVSLSKGAADVRLALEGAPALAAKLRAWISICGLLRGSPVANELLGQPLRRRLVTRLSLAALGGGYGALAELRYGPGTLLGRPFRAPPALPAISVVGFPLSSHLSPTVRQRHQRLAALGPNDGSTPLLDAILPGSLVYPVWSADHYFRVPQGARLLYQLFAHLAQTAPEAAPPSPAPAPASTASTECAERTQPALRDQRPPGDQRAQSDQCALGDLGDHSESIDQHGERIPVSLGGAPDYTVPARIQSWYLACASGDLPVGGVRGIELLGQPLVLFRTESGAVRALSAHCWHMGTHLGTGAVAGEYLQCPLHRWEFDGRGLCRRTPTGRPPPGAHQVAYPAVERFGAVFVFSGPAPLFDLPRFRLAPEEELYFRPGPPVRLRSPWYALVCNGFDLQHLQTVHARGLRQPAVVER
ncbi:MAG TPA: Rieske 2Fe-2S domain-containing protein, partial [Chloroflexota bacterium]|nr:Rieske 2Fe-2S domain-containing protein [Chloroflexota bacterium]